MCGDQNLDPDEVCDDGNLLDGDGCNRDCQPSLRILASTTFAGLGGARDIARSVGVGDDGRVVVGGAAAEMVGTAGFVIALDSELEQLWANDIDANADFADVWGVAVEEDGRVAAVGAIGQEAGSRGAIVYYEPNGTQAWGDTIGEGTDQDLAAAARSVALDTFGTIYAGGFANVFGIDVVEISRYPTNGPPKQANEYITPPADTAQVANGVAVYPTGDVVYAGTETSAAGSVVLVGLHPAGAVSQVNFGPTGSVGRSVAIGHRDEVVVVGSLGARPTLWAGQFNTALDPVWTQEFAGALGTLHDIAVAADGTYYVVGTIEGLGGSNDVYVAHLDEAGTVVDSEQHDLGGGQDAAHGIAVDPLDGTLLVVGEQQITLDDYDAFVLRLAP
jgi:cysteine-rich repeat protein